MTILERRLNDLQLCPEGCSQSFDGCLVRDSQFVQAGGMYCNAGRELIELLSQLTGGTDALLHHAQALLSRIGSPLNLMESVLHLKVLQVLRGHCVSCSGSRRCSRRLWSCWRKRLCGIRYGEARMSSMEG